MPAYRLIASPDDALEHRIREARHLLLCAPEQDRRERMMELERLIKQRSQAQIERMEKARGLA